MHTKTYVRVEDNESRFQKPILMPVIRMTDESIFTQELFSINLRDFSMRYIRRKELRWRRGSGVRHGESPDMVRFRITAIISGDEIDTLDSSVIVLQ